MHEMLLVLVMAVSMLLPICIFLAWLVAEFRWRRSIRIALALAWMLYLLFDMWVPAPPTARVAVALHRGSLYKIATLLETGQEVKVRRALRAYTNTYDTAKEEMKALAKLESVLQEPNAEGGKGDKSNY